MARVNEDENRTLATRVRSVGTRAGLPSSARRSSQPADEDASLTLPGEDGIWSTDDDWPGHFGAARLGIP